MVENRSGNDGRAASDPADGRAEIRFNSTVRAREIHFHEVPDTRVDFTGSPGHDSASGSERTNLPNPVRSGVTYHDVQVDYRIVSKLATDPDDF